MTDEAERAMDGLPPGIVIIGAEHIDAATRRLIINDLVRMAQAVCAGFEPVKLSLSDDLLERVPLRDFPFERESFDAKPVAEVYGRESEVAALRRDNQWREKRARAMFNVRANAERRLRKQMRGIGRR